MAGLSTRMLRWRTRAAATATATAHVACAVALAAVALPLLASAQTVPKAPAPAATDTRRSGADYMRPDTQAMQRDDNQNPAMLWIKGGEASWQSAPGQSKSCAGCHGDAASSMRGVAARYPAFDAALGLPVNLGQRINQCRVRHQQLPALAAEHEDLLGLETYVAMQSRGLPVAPPGDARLAPFVARGRDAFVRRIGQVNLSCAQCHDEHAGQRLAGSTIPQGHASGYPIYRLEWQGMGSLQRRLRNCMAGVRADVPPFGAPQLVELELYLAQRAKGMPVETPAVRP